MEYQNYERTQSSVSRKELLQGAFDDMGLMCVVDRLGEHVAIAGLYEEGILVSEGAGKGDNCEIGAMAESLEHYCLQNEFEGDGNNYSIEAVSGQRPLCRDGVIRSLSEFCGDIECVRFNGVSQGDEVVVPKALVSPWDYVPNSPCGFFLERYSTNSGSAFGCTLDEALLHGVNEVVERHVLSLFMLESVGGISGVKINEMPPGMMGELFVSLGLEVDEAIRVYYVSDFFESYFFLAIRAREECEFLLPQLGAGCSQSFALAFSRAVFELRQAEALYGYEERLVDEQAVRIIERSKRLEGLRQLRPESAQLVFEYPSLFGVNAQQPGLQFERIVRSLKLNGYEVYYRVVRKINELAYVVQVYVPGLERFNLIRSGKWVAPQEALLRNLS